MTDQTNNSDPYWTTEEVESTKKLLQQIHQTDDNSNTTPDADGDTA